MLHNTKKCEGVMYVHGISVCAKESVSSTCPAYVALAVHMSTLTQICIDGEPVQL